MSENLKLCAVSTASTNMEKQVDIKYEVDSANRLSRKEVMISGKMVYTSAMEYHWHKKMVEISDNLL